MEWTLLNYLTSVNHINYIGVHDCFDTVSHCDCCQPL